MSGTRVWLTNDDTAPKKVLVWARRPSRTDGADGWKHSKDIPIGIPRKLVDMPLPEEGQWLLRARVVRSRDGHSVTVRVSERWEEYPYSIEGATESPLCTRGKRILLGGDKPKQQRTLRVRITA